LSAVFVVGGIAEEIAAFPATSEFLIEELHKEGYVAAGGANGSKGGFSYPGILIFNRCAQTCSPPKIHNKIKHKRLIDMTYTYKIALFLLLHKK
jgi:hypothetical protein